MIIKKENIKVIKSKYTEEGFLKDVLNKLYEEPTVPNDVFLSKFRKIEKSYIDIIVLKTNYESTFSLEWENKKELKTTIPGDTTKLVVSEWVPFEDTQETQIDFFIWNDINKYKEKFLGSFLPITEETYNEHKWISKHLLKLEYEENAIIEKEIEIDDSLVTYIEAAREEKIIAEALLQKKFKVPGTNWRSIKSNDTFKESKYFIYRMPIYRVEFEYQGKTYFAEKNVGSAFALSFKFPEVPKEQSAGSKAVKAESKYERIQVKAFIALIIAGVLTCAFHKIKILLILGIIIMVLSIVSMIILGKIKDEVFHKSLNNAKEDEKTKRAERRNMYENAKKQLNLSIETDKDLDYLDLSKDLENYK